MEMCAGFLLHLGVSPKENISPPYLFILVSDAVSTTVSKASLDNQIHGSQAGMVM